MMPRYRCLVAVAFSLVLTPVVWAQEDTPPPLEVTHITGNLHKLYFNGQVAVIASIGKDGLLLVDTAYAHTAVAAREALDGLKAGPARMIINTHGDLDHVGGNAVLGGSATIIAHPDVRARMSTFFSLPAVEVEGLPNIAVEHDTTIIFNGEEIRVLPMPGGHTSGDLVVHFTGSNVLCLGDLVLSGTFPNADPGRGGDAQRLVEVLQRLGVKMPAETLLVPAHGGDIDIAGLKKYIGMVEGTIAAVKKAIDNGHDLPAIIEENPLAPWAEWERADTGLSFENWTREIHASLSGEYRLSINVPVTESLVGDGVKAAVATYHLLKREEPDRWDFSERRLNLLGYQLLQRDMVDEAIEVFRLNVEMYPESFNPYDSLGEAYLAAGRKDLAIANYERSLELNSDNDNAARALERLRAE